MSSVTRPSHSRRAVRPRRPPTAPNRPNRPQIERVDDSTFRCFVGQLAFLGFSVEPVITVSVSVQERGCTIRLLSCELQGSKMVEDVNDKFTAQVGGGRARHARLPACHAGPACVRGGAAAPHARARACLPFRALCPRRKPKTHPMRTPRARKTLCNPPRPAQNAR